MYFKTNNGVYRFLQAQREHQNVDTEIVDKSPREIGYSLDGVAWSIADSSANRVATNVTVESVFTKKCETGCQPMVVFCSAIEHQNVDIRISSFSAFPGKIKQLAKFDVETKGSDGSCNQVTVMGGTVDGIARSIVNMSLKEEAAKVIVESIVTTKSETECQAIKVNSPAALVAHNVTGVSSLDAASSSIVDTSSNRVYKKAPNQSYKLGKSWEKAAAMYLKLAGCHIKLESKHETASTHSHTANAHKKISPKEAISCLDKAVVFFSEIGRSNMAGKYCEEIRELYEAEKDSKQAIKYLERAAELLSSEEGTPTANQCRLKSHNYLLNWKTIKLLLLQLIVLWRT